eukprot:CAMPEP_0198303258 /NCGR_PEP_ID=MMETSP1449-20131203/56793_1 /TAXON_ID=420275 /ORGANISM="Attheya septentrionalis, Strain CCMP2084" /LENGTH=1029 /DNA_ID=CAMNT_0044005745 /DNA_START=155 /DNA_END=3244 /DNA_ORIENTATION=-
MSASKEHTDYLFRSKIDNALKTVKKILDTTRNPTQAASQDHTYDDKFGLAEFLTNVAVAAQTNVLERLGMDDTKLKILRDYASEDYNRSLTLRFEAKQTCKFLKKDRVDLEGPDRQEYYGDEHNSSSSHNLDMWPNDARKGNPLKNTFFKSKVVTKVTHYHWRVAVEYSVFAFAGNDPEQFQLLFQSRKSFQDVVTTDDSEPFPKETAHKPIDLDLMWFMRQFKTDDEDDQLCCFTINRKLRTCLTPRRNVNVEEAMKFFKSSENWSREIVSFFISVEISINQESIVEAPEDESGKLFDIDAGPVFVPVLPLFEKPSQQKSSDGLPEAVHSDASAKSSSLGFSRSPLLSVSDIRAFLQEQCRSLDKVMVNLKQMFPSRSAGNKVASEQEACLVLLSLHSSALADTYDAGMEYIENMLRSQLVAAIGIEVKPADFDEFMRFHNKKLFRNEFSPEPFCHAVRLPKQFPVGTIDIEGHYQGESKHQPITTISRRIQGASNSPIFIPINASTSVTFTGDRLLHGWVNHQHEGSNNMCQFNLVARARQFSSFLLLVGKMNGADKFDPKDGIILQNKDEVIIPLLLNQLPSGRDFKDTAASLSPEQKRFATSFRGMQLEGSVFGVCVIQLKPQFEALLGLPKDSLMKEIRLTEEILSLFIDYQIPADLLSCNIEESATTKEKVDDVKAHVAHVRSMIKTTKKVERNESGPVGETDDYSRGGSVSNKSYSSATAQRKKQAQRLKARQPSHHLPPTILEFEVEEENPAESTSASYKTSKAGQSHYNRMQMDTMTVVSMDESTIFEDITEFDAFDSDSVSVISRSSVSRASAPMRSYSPTKRGSIKRTPFTPRSTASTKKTAKKPMTINIDKQQKMADMRGTPSDHGVHDFTSIPRKLDMAFVKFETDAVLRPTSIEVGETWRMIRYLSMSEPIMEPVNLESRKSERNKALDLLDALSRSGSLPISAGELHVIVAVTHCFDKSVTEAVIQANVNPIEKLEKSMLIVTACIHNVKPAGLVKGTSQLESVMLHSPDLFHM